MLKRTGIVVCVLVWVTCAAATALAQTAPRPQNVPVYTICTLLVGSAPPAAASTEAHGIMMALSSSSLSQLESAQQAENLADLQEKLRAAFHLDQLDVVSSYGDWMSPGRQMVLEGASGLKLAVTSGADKGYAETEVVVHRSEGASYSKRRENMKSTQFDLLLTLNGKPLLKRSWAVSLGTRSVLARQVEANGPLYFVVLALPQPGVPMRTTWGLEMQGTKAGGTTGVASGVAGGQGKGSGVGVGVGSGIGVGVGSGIGQEVHAPKQLRVVQPRLTAEARAAGLKGPVILSGWIAPDGTVQDIKVLKSVEGLDQLAIAAFKQWRYTSPVDAAGKPFPIQVTVVFPFNEEPDENS